MASRPFSYRRTNTFCDISDTLCDISDNIVTTAHGLAVVDELGEDCSVGHGMAFVSHQPDILAFHSPTSKTKQEFKIEEKIYNSHYTYAHTYGRQLKVGRPGCSLGCIAISAVRCVVA